jgi:hypothetical protein
MDEKPKTFYVTLTKAGTDRILGYLTIDRETFAVVPKANTMRLREDDLECVVKDLKAGKVVGQVGEFRWHEGRGEGVDPPEDSKSNW